MTWPTPPFRYSPEQAFYELSHQGNAYSELRADPPCMPFERPVPRHKLFEIVKETSPRSQGIRELVALLGFLFAVGLGFPLLLLYAFGITSAVILASMTLPLSLIFFYAAWIVFIEKLRTPDLEHARLSLPAATIQPGSTFKASFRQDRRYGRPLKRSSGVAARLTCLKVTVEREPAWEDDHQTPTVVWMKEFPVKPLGATERGFQMDISTDLSPLLPASNHRSFELILWCLEIQRVWGRYRLPPLYFILNVTSHPD